MRSLNKNKRGIYYALYIGETPILDEYGNETGESDPTYGDMIELRCNVSGASGEEAVQAFGSFPNYSRVICVADNNCPIEEQTVVWFGVAPTEPYNYIVTRKADSKNGILYALQEVKVSS
jgi:hypothetical protein